MNVGEDWDIELYCIRRIAGPRGSFKTRGKGSHSDELHKDLFLASFGKSWKGQLKVHASNNSAINIDLWKGSSS